MSNLIQTIFAQGRNLRRNLRKSLAAVLLLGAVAACSPQFQNHGYAPDDDQLSLVEVGVSTKEDVAIAVGRPTSQGILEQSGWYYVQSRFKHFTYNEPKEIERSIVAISFNDKGVVSNVERFGLEDGKAIVLSRRVTESNIQGISFLKQLIGNLGRVTNDDLFGNTNF
ncbi:MAG: outer membrane protein assembly factor BamE (lipoprotein component of BamABCDE complex) [Halocynthiibacter sp.]|jgi:outer membrane protein assembly factor BamE (lipoprotein component of BamABCDE complex)